MLNQLNWRILWIEYLYFYSSCFASFYTGINAWPGKQLHSHNYRRPEPYQNKVCTMLILSSILRVYV